MSEQSKQLRKLAYKASSTSVARLMIEFADYMETTEDKHKELSSLNDRLQDRVVELEQRQPEWVYYSCNVVYPLESIKNASDCLCPSGCGGVLNPRSQTEMLLERRIEELEQELAAEKECHKTTYSLMRSGEQRGIQKATEELQPKIDELSAHLKCLTKTILDFNNKNHDLNMLLCAARKSPTISLADRDANTITNAIKECGNNGKVVRMVDGYYISESFLWDYANQLSEGVASTTDHK